eukprot:11514045-Alexandrium_andersonii.AAC.1
MPVWWLVLIGLPPTQRATPGSTRAHMDDNHPVFVTTGRWLAPLPHNPPNAPPQIRYRPASYLRNSHRPQPPSTSYWMM